MNLPADIPSYLSSQGTLSEPQEGYSNSEAGSHQQLMPPLSNGYVHKGTDGDYRPLPGDVAVWFQYPYSLYFCAVLLAKCCCERFIVFNIHQLKWLTNLDSALH